MYIRQCWYTAAVTDEQVPISEARANLSDVVASVRLLRRCVLLTQRGKPRAAIIPVELGEAVIAAGGPDAVLRILERHLPLGGG